MKKDIFTLQDIIPTTRSSKYNEQLTTIEPHQHHRPGCEPTFSFPRELALETLYTTRLLFHLGDAKDQEILAKLVVKDGFDPDILRPSVSVFDRGPDEVERAKKFTTWGTRLLDLLNEIDNPTPRKTVDKWFEQNSKSRHQMVMALASLMVTSIISLLTLVVAIIQLVVSIKQPQSN